MNNLISDDEIIDKILSRAKEKGSVIIQVEHIMKSEFGIRDQMAIQRILRRFVEEGIGGKSVAGGALYLTELSRKISEEGYINYLKRIELERVKEEEHKRVIFENDKLTLELNRHELKFKGIHLFIIIASFVISVVALVISFIK